MNRYPAAARKAFSYVLHGSTIPEPYGWLEDPDSSETKSFVDSQNAHFRTDFPEDSPLRLALKNQLKRTFYPRTSAPFPHNGKYYYFYNTGLENQSRLLRSSDLESAKNSENEEVFLDVNTLSAAGTTALRATAWSKSGRYYAYGLSDAGSDWMHIHVRASDERMQDLEVDVVHWVKYSGISWLGDHGFFYTRFPELEEKKEDKGSETDSALNGSVYYHKLETSQNEDVQILAIPENPRWLANATVSDCMGYLVATVSNGCEPKNLIWIAKIPQGFSEDPHEHYRNIDFIQVINEWVGENEYLGNDEDVFYFQTTKDAPMRKIVSMKFPSGEYSDLLVERKNCVLSHALLCQDTFIVVYLEDVKDIIYTCQLKKAKQGALSFNDLKKIDLPVGSIVSIDAERDTSFISFKVTSFTIPGRSYIVHDVNNFKLETFRHDIVEGLIPDDYIVKQIFVDSTDNAKIPMFIIHHKDVKMDQPQPTLLYGYGGFNISLTPSFVPFRLVFLNSLRGVYALANIRGGGEYGESWHNAGRKDKKENCFVDFINCAKYLNSQPFCDGKHLCIQGGSNGGMLVSVSANKAPEEFAGVVAQVGVMDGYKFHKFTIGHAWRSDYGDPDIKEDFDIIKRYSPLHNINAKTHNHDNSNHNSDVVYPQVFVVTGDHDDRVVPLHSLKYIATLQHEAKGGPFYAMVEVAAGHGAGKPTSKVIDENADILTFIAKVTKAKLHESLK